MMIIKPDFFDKFVCAADKCTMTCCQEWKIAVDEETNEKWKHLPPPESPEQKKRKQNLSGYTIIREGQRIIALEKNQKCPFLNEEKLCKLVIQYGDQVLSETCSIFPREIHDFGSRVEYSLMPCCPAVIDLLKDQKRFELICQKSEGEKQQAQTEELFEARTLFCDMIMEKAYPMEDKCSIEMSLLKIFYIALDLQEQEEKNGEWKAKLSFYRQKSALQELDRAISEVVLEPFFTLEERNELFLDLAVNYRKEGLYQNVLEPAARLAEDFEESCAKAEKEQQTKILEEKWKCFERDMQQYDSLFRNFMVGEFYSDCLIPEGSLTDMVVKIQWIAMEYAVIRQVLFLQWQKNGSLSYETIRDFIVVICRMMGYEDEDIREYLKNSFESLIWDWGYFALIIGK